METIKWSSWVSQYAPNKSKMADGRHFENPLNYNFCNRLVDFDEIWHSDAHWPLTVDRPLKFSIFLEI